MIDLKIDDDVHCFNVYVARFTMAQRVYVMA